MKEPSLAQPNLFAEGILASEASDDVIVPQVRN